MFTHRTAAYALLAFLLPFGERQLSAQAPVHALNQLASPNYEVRRAGFYAILKQAGVSPSEARRKEKDDRLRNFVKTNPDVSPALIRLLERENVPDPKDGTRGEESYYGDLIGTVAALRDTRAVNALLGSITTGAMAQDGLADLGTVAVQGVAALLRSENKYVRSSAAHTLGKLANRAAEMKLDTSVVRTALVGALGDPYLHARISAIRSLRSFLGADVRREIQRIAETDTATFYRNGRRVFPVRNEALEWLRIRDSAVARLR